MKIISLVILFCFLHVHSYTREIKNSSYPEAIDTTAIEKYDLLKQYYLIGDYREVIRESTFILEDSVLQVPADFYRYLACSYYQTGDLRSAYGQMVVYVKTQDSVLVNDYDIYLCAQFAARLKNINQGALDILREAYDKDTCLANKKIYAAAMVNHYLQIGSKYAATVWRETLLPLKELSREEMYRISQAWYTFNEEGNIADIFGQFASVYPNAFRSLYMHGGIKIIPGNNSPIEVE